LLWDLEWPLVPKDRLLGWAEKGEIKLGLEVGSTLSEVKAAPLARSVLVFEQLFGMWRWSRNLLSFLQRKILSASLDIQRSEVQINYHKELTKTLFVFLSITLPLKLEI
jgi:hypothetical protein